MSPPIPAECDSCAKRLPNPALICSRCKAYAYCSKVCQADDWMLHKTRCSALPEGELTPAKIGFSQERAEAVDKVERLLTELMVTIRLRTGSTGLSEGVLDLLPDAASGNIQQVNNLINYELPPSLNSPQIPGSKRTPPDSPKHKLAQFTRLFLIHELSMLTPAQAQSLFSPARLAQTETDLDASGYPGVPQGLAPRVRLYGPKVLAAPEQLSLDEYSSVVHNFVFGRDSVAPGDKEGVWKWEALTGVAPLVVGVSAERGGFYPFSASRGR